MSTEAATGGVLLKKMFIKIFKKFIGIHLYQSLYLIKLQTGNSKFMKKETLAQVFSCEFGEIFKNTVFTERLRGTVSVSTYFWPMFPFTLVENTRKQLFLCCFCLGIQLEY